MKAKQKIRQLNKLHRVYTPYLRARKRPLLDDHNPLWVLDLLMPEEVLIKVFRSLHDRLREGALLLRSETTFLSFNNEARPAAPRANHNDLIDKVCARLPDIVFN